MKKSMNKFKFITALSFLLMFGWQNAIAQSNPIELLQSISNQMITGLKKAQISLKKNPTLVYSLAGKIIVPHADLTEMSKRVLPPNIWNSASNDQRSEFKKEFSTTLIRTYASAMAEYTNEVIQFFPIRGGYAGKSIVKVDSQISRDDGPAISVSYQLISENNDWKLYDLTVEGISMLESFRSQFADTLSRGNIAELIKVLKQHNLENNQSV